MAAAPETPPPSARISARSIICGKGRGREGVCEEEKKAVFRFFHSNEEMGSADVAIGGFRALFSPLSRAATLWAPARWRPAGARALRRRCGPRGRRGRQTGAARARTGGRKDRRCWLPPAWPLVPPPFLSLSALSLSVSLSFLRSARGLRECAWHAVYVRVCVCGRVYRGRARRRAVVNRTRVVNKERWRGGRGRGCVRKKRQDGRREERPQRKTTALWP